MFENSTDVEMTWWWRNLFFSCACDFPRNLSENGRLWSSFHIKNTIHCADSIMSVCHSIYVCLSFNYVRSSFNDVFLSFNYVRLSFNYVFLSFDFVRLLFNCLLNIQLICKLWRTIPAKNSWQLNSIFYTLHLEFTSWHHHLCLWSTMHIWALY